MNIFQAGSGVRKSYIAETKKILADIELQLETGSINIFEYKSGLVKAINVLEELNEGLIEMPKEKI